MSFSVIRKLQISSISTFNSSHLLHYLSMLTRREKIFIQNISKMRSFSKTLNFFIFLNLFMFIKHGNTDDVLNGFHGNERDALLAFKSGFNKSFLDKNWTGIMCYKNVKPYWFGIECSDGRVTGIRLENLGLTGDFPVSDVVFNLTELSVISLKNNSISGNIIDFSKNQKLTEIDLSKNSFVGPIPSSLVTINSLSSLQLQENNLSGEIPFFNQSSLKQFNVSFNNLSGVIPNTSLLQSLNVESFFGNKNLCGPPSPTTCIQNNFIQPLSYQDSDNSKDSEKSKKTHLLVILLIVIIFILCVFLLFSLVYFRKRSNLKKQLKAKYILNADEEKTETEKEKTATEKEKEKTATEKEKEIEGTSEKGTVGVGGGGDIDEDRGKLVFVNGKQSFEVEELLKAKAESLGQGSFGNCYKVMFEEGMTSLVVKRLRSLKGMGKEEYMKQVKRIAELKHPNLLPFVAFYYSKEEKLLLHYFASNGNAFKRLHGGKGSPSRIPFRWGSRLAVATGVARALEHLHLKSKTPNTTPPHGNLKLSNVLFDENDAVLLTDYGLTSLIASPIAEHRMVSYKSPEFRTTKKLSKKSDVWSYGCLLLELLTGKISADSAPLGVRNAVDICNWVHRVVREEWTGEVFDVEIAVQRSANHAMVRLLQIAIRCCDVSPEKRPDMSDVVVDVEKIVAVTDSGSEEDLQVSGSITDDSFVGNFSMIPGENHE